MNIDFDFRSFQKESQERLAKIYAESLIEQEYQDENESDETYNKIRKLLDCVEAEKCHPYLYQLDMENVNEADKQKIDKLYNLCLERGMIQEDDNIEDEIDNQDEFCDDGELCGGPSDSLTGQELNTQPIVPKPIFTVLYSGMKEGDLKMGEFYSMAASTDGSKEDCIAQLTQQGYQSINIMAVEQTTPAINTDFRDQLPQQDITTSDVYKEDDSLEYLRQETGDTQEVTDKEKEEKTDDISSDDVSSDDTEIKDIDPETDDKEETEDKSDDNEEEIEDKSDDNDKEEAEVEDKEETKEEDVEKAKEDEEDENEEDADTKDEKKE